MIDRVLLVILARCNQGPRSLRGVSRKEAALAGGVASAFYDEETTVAGEAHAQVEALIRLFQHQRVLFGVTHAMAEEFVVALGLLVFRGVEERLSVRRPGEGADALCGIGEHLSGGEILEVQRVLAEAGVIGGVGKQSKVGAEAHAANGHKRLILSELVDV